MVGFGWNLLLAVLWMTANGRFTTGDLLVGGSVGYVVLWFGRRAIGTTEYVAKPPRLFGFVLYYLGQLVLANLRVAYDVVTPTHHMHPGVLALPLDARTDGEIALLAHLINLTPGNLSLDVSADRRVLYVHFMYIDRGDFERARRRLKDGLERRLLEVMR